MDNEQSAETVAELVPVDAPIHAQIHALLFGSGEPMTLASIQDLLGVSKEDAREAVELIRERCADEGSGVELVNVDGGFQLRTKAYMGGVMRRLRAGKPRRLSGAALETLAIVAYRQPIVRSDIEKLRGVDVTPTLNTLLDRGLIRVVGHANTVGQPALFGTTNEFLKIFGLESLSALPTLRDLRELDTAQTSSTEIAEAPEADAA